VQFLAKRSNCARAVNRTKFKVSLRSSFARRSRSRLDRSSHHAFASVRAPRSRDRRRRRPSHARSAHLVRSIHFSAPLSVEDSASCRAGEPPTLRFSRRNTRADPFAVARRRPWTTARRSPSFRVASRARDARARAGCGSMCRSEAGNDFESRAEARRGGTTRLIDAAAKRGRFGDTNVRLNDD